MGDREVDAHPRSVLGAQRASAPPAPPKFGAERRMGGCQLDRYPALERIS
jgi:hypothetical protein